MKCFSRKGAKGKPYFIISFSSFFLRKMIRRIAAEAAKSINASWVRGESSPVLTPFVVTALSSGCCVI